MATKTPPPFDFKEISGWACSETPLKTVFLKEIWRETKKERGKSF
ncbi:MAG: hypothetical protein WCH85_06710 [Methanomicrobiales archaeon]